MKNDLPITATISIPEDELEITASKSGGPGGQHVNKTNSRITVRWHVPTTHAVSDTKREYLRTRLAPYLTADGDLIIHSSSSRSQLQNKQLALAQLAQKVRAALVVPKQRRETAIPYGIQEKRLQHKTKRSSIKKMRSKKYED